MSNSDVTLQPGDSYIVFYTGGPNDGQTDERISIDGAWDDEIVSFTAVDGLETGLAYKAGEAVKRGDQVQVSYVYSPVDSDPIEDLEDRGEH